MNRLQTLKRGGSPLAEPEYQVQWLERNADDRAVPAFHATLDTQGMPPLAADGIDVLQVNLGKLCNQTCRHCHVDAGPDRREAMDRRTADACLDVLRQAGIPVLDITGGAPEMNPHFRHLIERAARLGVHVIDRCNLTILLAPGYRDLPRFLARHRVEVVASLPCYLEENTDRQRGDGVFRKSIEALQELNRLGYGDPESGLRLTLVYNPVGPSLPPPQRDLEAAYRRQLWERHQVRFSRLYTIANLPISRFLDDLVAQGQYESYMQTLVEAFNPAAVAGLMCRTTLSVDWQGRLYDCDFNQMLELGLADGVPGTIFDFDASALAKRRIATGRHCYGCTAGAGSGCQGAIVD